MAALFGTALITGVVPAAASAACPSHATTAALVQFGDNAAYSLLSGSSFESGAPGWSLSNAEVDSEEGAQESSSSLAIGPYGVAVSPAFCVSSEYPSFRFFARQLSGGGSLNVGLRWTDMFRVNHETPVASLQVGNSWTLSPVLGLATALPLWMRGGSTLTVRVVFRAGGGGSWAIDNVYIDPYSR